jgi:hypothetical protein
VTINAVLPRSTFRETPEPQAGQLTQQSAEVERTEAPVTPGTPAASRRQEDGAAKPSPAVSASLAAREALVRAKIEGNAWSPSSRQYIGDGPGGASPSATPARGGGAASASENLATAKALLQNGNIRGTPTSGTLRFLTDRGINIELKSGSGSFYDAQAHKIVLNGESSPQEMAAFMVFASYRIASGNEPAERGEYVKSNLQNVAEAATRAIEFKRGLQDGGANKVPLEAVYADAYNQTYAKVFNEEISVPLHAVTKLRHTYEEGFLKAAGLTTDITAANYLARLQAETAGDHAVETAVRQGKLLTGDTRETYEVYFGKEFDRKQAERAKKEEEAAKVRAQAQIEAEQRAKLDKAVDALATLVKRADPNSPAAGQLIDLIGAFVAANNNTQRIGFISSAGDALEKLLGPFGFRQLDGSGAGLVDLQVRRLEHALANYWRLSPHDRAALRQNPLLDADRRYGINYFPTPAELEAADRVYAIRTLPDGTTHEGTLADYRVAAENNRINHILEQLDSIANSGPGALAGRLIGGEKGAALGAVIDAGLMFAAPVKASMSNRAQMNAYRSGGLEVSYSPPPPSTTQFVGSRARTLPVEGPMTSPAKGTVNAAGLGALPAAVRLEGETATHETGAINARLRPEILRNLVQRGNAYGYREAPPAGHLEEVADHAARGGAKEIHILMNEPALGIRDISTEPVPEEVRTQRMIEDRYPGTRVILHNARDPNGFEQFMEAQARARTGEGGVATIAGFCENVELFPEGEAARKRPALTHTAGSAGLRLPLEIGGNLVQAGNAYGYRDAASAEELEAAADQAARGGAKQIHILVHDAASGIRDLVAAPPFSKEISTQQSIQDRYPGTRVILNRASVPHEFEQFKEAQARARSGERGIATIAEFRDRAGFFAEDGAAHNGPAVSDTIGAVALRLPREIGRNLVQRGNAFGYRRTTVAAEVAAVAYYAARGGGKEIHILTNAHGGPGESGFRIKLDDTGRFLREDAKQQGIIQYHYQDATVILHDALNPVEFQQFMQAQSRASSGQPGVVTIAAICYSGELLAEGEHTVAGPDPRGVALKGGNVIGVHEPPPFQALTEVIGRVTAPGPEGVTRYDRVKAAVDALNTRKDQQK